MLRWAILGTGFISNTVIDAIDSSEGSCVELIAGRNAERVTAAQRAHSIPRGVVGYDAAITKHGPLLGARIGAQNRGSIEDDKFSSVVISKHLSHFATKIDTDFIDFGG